MKRKNRSVVRESLAITAAIMSFVVGWDPSPRVYSQEETAQQESGPQDDVAAGGEVIDQFEPYDVYVDQEQVVARCGPGGEYYRTDPLRHGQKLEVYLEADKGWLGVRPPEGSFSWVTADAIQLDRSGKIGKVIEDGTLSWIGTHLGKARKYLWQVQLAAGETVTILGRAEREGPDGPQLWYRIAPPAGEFRWVHRDQVVENPEELLRDKPKASDRYAQGTPELAEPIAGEGSGSFAGAARTKIQEKARSILRPVAVEQASVPSQQAVVQQTLGQQSIIQQAPGQQALGQQAMGQQRGGESPRPLTRPSQGVATGAVPLIALEAPEAIPMAVPGTRKPDWPTNDTAGLDPIGAIRALAAGALGRAPEGQQGEEALAPLTPPALPASVVATSAAPASIAAADRSLEDGFEPIGSAVVPNVTAGVAPGVMPANAAAPGGGSPVDMTTSVVTSPTIMTTPVVTQPELTTSVVTNPIVPAAVNPPLVSIASQPAVRPIGAAGEQVVSDVRQAGGGWDVSSGRGMIPAQGGVTTASYADLSGLSVDGLQSELSRKMIAAARAEELEGLRLAAEKIAASGVSQVDRQKGSELALRIRQYQSVAARRDGGSAVATAGAIAPAVFPPAQIAPAGVFPPGQIDLAGRPATQPEASGYLVQVYSARPESPPFALTDATGRTTHYVSPNPGYNLRRFLNQHIIISGPAGHDTGLDTPHIIATSAVRSPDPR
ncbi:MAG: hypothetical protein RI963_3484 [Planctomycetota bacterium]